MKQTQQGFIGIVAVIVVALAIGGGVYYQQTGKRQVSVETTTEIERDIPKQQDTKVLDSIQPASSMTEAQARAIALKSECGTEGALSSEGYYGENSSSFWNFGIESKTGAKCASFCTVDVKTKTAEIQWMCTGVIPSSEESLKQVPVLTDPSTL